MLHLQPCSRLLRVTLGFCACLLLTACASRVEAPPFSVSSIHQSAQCGHASPRMAVDLIQTPEQLALAVSFTDAEFNGSTARRKIQADFDHTIVRVSLGQKPTGGYAIQYFGGATLDGDILTIPAQVTEPAPGTAVTQAITSPCVVIQTSLEQVRVVKVTDQSGTLLAASAFRN